MIGGGGELTGQHLRFGLYLPAMGPLADPTSLVDLAVRAEAAGWDGVFLWDHVLAGDMPIADTWTVLAAMAVSTSRILVGPMVTPLPRRRPWVVARQAATVSSLSHGRLVLGVGLGVDETGDLSSFGEDMPVKERRERLDEGIAIIRRMWSGGGTSFHGKHYRADLPASPAHAHPLRIWLASSTGASSVLARARDNEGIFHNPDSGLTSSDVADLVARIRPADQPLPDDFDVVVRGNASSAWPEPHPTDLASYAAAGMTWWLEALIYFDPLEMSLDVVDAGPEALNRP